jgi:glycyl-tRNA synthetase beta chain
LVRADPKLTAQAARLCKADLASSMVGEFPELQGVMGGYYARASGLPEAVVEAIRDHYKPQGPSDVIPTAPVTVAVALADKLESLSWFFAEGEEPSGSRDPYALRRAALGFIRILLETDARLPLNDVLYERESRLIQAEYDAIAERVREGVIREYLDGRRQSAELREALSDEHVHLFTLLDAAEAAGNEVPPEVAEAAKNIGLAYAARPSQVEWQGSVWRSKSILAFFADRLKVLLREQGRRHDLVDAVFALGDDDLVRIVARVEALDGFLRSEDGANLLAGYRRAVNILKAEAKKGGLPEGAWAEHAAAAPEETALAAALAQATAALEPALAAEDFAAAMAALSRLRAPVDAFFDLRAGQRPRPEVRAARLRLLGQVRDAMNRVADFSLVTG